MRRAVSEFTMQTMWKEPTTTADLVDTDVAVGGSLQAHRISTSTKGVTLRTYLLASVAAMAAVAAVSAGSAFAGPVKSAKIVQFEAIYAGAANVTVADGLATISANGTGKGALIGPGKVTGKGTGSADESATCQVFNGTGTMAGTKGKINFKMTGAQACGDSEGNLFSITGRAVVTSGTLAFKKAKGSLKVTGSYNKTAKNFTIKVKGPLSV
jgi:hypothetical protein